jgi:ribosomal protein S27E
MPASTAHTVDRCATLILMEVHGSRQIGRRQEIRCTDCKHTYVIAEGQLSSRCTYCGNISTHHAKSRVLNSAVLNDFQTEVSRLPSTPNPLAQFHVLPDGNAVQDILSRYQVEWQLWAVLVKNFADPIYHSAYISQAISKNVISQASDRYRAHGAVMVLNNDDRWQSEVSDLMLSRLENLSLLRLQQTETADLLYLRWLALVNDYPLRAKIFRFAWIVGGMAMVLRLCFFALGWR